MPLFSYSGLLKNFSSTQSEISLVAEEMGDMHKALIFLFFLISFDGISVSSIWQSTGVKFRLMVEHCFTVCTKKFEEAEEREYFYSNVQKTLKE